jgi:hypothetical protein
MSTPIDVAKPVCLAYQELKHGDFNLLLKEAFGDEPHCLGIVLIDMTSVPEYSNLRQTLLSYASYLAALPPQELQKLENSHAKYVVGWSHGKERLGNGMVDTRKGIQPRILHKPIITAYIGSYYANPTRDAAIASPEMKEIFPEYTEPNIWPSEDTLPGFRGAFERLSRLIIEIAMSLAIVNLAMVQMIADTVGV